MPVSCQVVVANGPTAIFNFEEVPRVGDYLALPNAPRQFLVNRVVFEPVEVGPTTVGIFVS